MDKSIVCKYCGSTAIVRFGTYKGIQGKVHSWLISIFRQCILLANRARRIERSWVLDGYLVGFYRYYVIYSLICFGRTVQTRCWLFWLSCLFCGRGAVNTHRLTEFFKSFLNYSLVSPIENWNNSISYETRVLSC